MLASTTSATSNCARAKVLTSFPPRCFPFELETNVLERLGGPPVEPGGGTVASTSGGEVALRQPGRGTVAVRGQLLEARLREREHLVGLVELALLHQRAPEHELHASDLVEEVDAAVEKPERVPRLLLRKVDLPGPQM